MTHFIPIKWRVSIGNRFWSGKNFCNHNMAEAREKYPRPRCTQKEERKKTSKRVCSLNTRRGAASTSVSDTPHSFGQTPQRASAPPPGYAQSLSRPEWEQG